MDEGRLGVVIRQEERHRKFVYMMNDIVRAHLDVYNNCLAREQHEASVKFGNSCVEVRRSIVRQKVLRKCLEMRKRKVLSRDSLGRFGQYGGKPLWAMSRDIERVIADNHPRLRRIRRADEMMRKSLESGAILDEDAVHRRMDAFFQVRQGRQQQKNSTAVDQSAQMFRQGGQILKLPPIGATNSGSSSQKTSRQNKAAGAPKDDEGSSARSRQPKDRTQNEAGGELSSKGKHRNEGSTPSMPSLKLDKKGRLIGVRTSQLYNRTDTIEEKDEDVEKDAKASDEKEHANKKQTSDTENESTRQTFPAGFVEKPARKIGVVEKPREAARNSGHGTKHNGGENIEEKGNGLEQKSRAQNGEEEENSSQKSDSEKNKPRSKLILPPLETSKALVRRT